MDMENPSFREVFERMWQHVLSKLNGFVTNENFNAHVEDKENPHDVTAEQVGLANVDNTSDMDKPISNLVQAALDAKADEYHTHDYASSSHTHSEYASSSHTHNNATTSKAGFMSASDKTKLDGISGNSDVLDAYPVGAIYISTVSTSPASLFGGTWTQLKDRFLLGAGSTYSAGSTGGSATHKLTINEMPIHDHDYTFPDETDVQYLPYEWWDTSTVGFPGGSDARTSDTGGGQAHNNMPPYLVVYMWKRTA